MFEASSLRLELDFSDHLHATGRQESVVAPAAASNVNTSSFPVGVAHLNSAVAQA